ncbi:MAG: LPXTG cell wall anchor domain-containing protein [Microbacteriaceae bacterium]|nr:MAG: LPXTG cell wall anchor domain-containing protein [Microbacteriaceae bacterium]
MKKYVMSCLAGLGIVVASVFSMPLSASADGYVPVDPCTQSNACVTSTVHVPESPVSGLADTGSTISVGLLGGAGAAVVAGGLVLVIARRRAHHSD